MWIAAVALAACSRANPAFEGEDTGGEGSSDDDIGVGDDAPGDDGSVSASSGVSDSADGSTGDGLPVDEECGDGVRNGAEECDDGELNGNNRPCLSSCVRNVCGDGHKAPGQPCDDGNEISGDGCTECQLDTCGNGAVDDGEDCDPTDVSNQNPCTKVCTTVECGDHLVSPGEDCDDGNGDDTDECTNECLLPECGDGIVTTTQLYSEQCDDGNEVSTDGCVECQTASCGDGFVREGKEQCDPLANAFDFNCIADGTGMQGVFVCSPQTCSWATETDNCCVPNAGECVTNEMCCSMQCEGGTCLAG